MNRHQKTAWFNLIVTAATVILTSIAIAVEFRIRGYSTIGLWFVALLVLLKFTRFLFKKPESPGGVVSDERDDSILKRAVLYAWAAFWWAFAVSCVLLFIIVGPENSVPTIVLPLMALAGGLFLKAACSVAILIQYGRANREASHE
jgi:hypothetical protein